MSQHAPLSVLVVEDQALVAMELQILIEDSGHGIVGWATDLDEAYMILEQTCPDLALVDIHLADGPTGTKLAADLCERGISVVFMTANAKRVPGDFAGAIGIMTKPYTAHSVTAALAYLHAGVRNPPPLTSLPAGLQLSPTFFQLWVAA